jgi:hypothetical protein
MRKYTGTGAQKVSRLIMPFSALAKLTVPGIIVSNRRELLEKNTKALLCLAPHFV